MENESNVLKDYIKELELILNSKGIDLPTKREDVARLF